MPCTTPGLLSMCVFGDDDGRVVVNIVVYLFSGLGCALVDLLHHEIVLRNPLHLPIVCLVNERTSCEVH